MGGRVLLDAVVVLGVVVVVSIADSVVVADLLSAVVTGVVLVGVAEVLRNSALVARVSDARVVAARVLGGLELLLDSSVLVLSIVVKIVSVATTISVGVVAMAANAATSVGGVGVNFGVIFILRLLDVSGARVRTTEVAFHGVDVVSILIMGMISSVVVLNLRGAGNGSEASKSKGLEHSEYLHPGSAQPI